MFVHSLFRSASRAVLTVAVFAAPFACKPANRSGLKEGVDYGGDYEGYEGAGLNPAQERGRRTWYEATGDNARFHTYIVSQKLGAPENWYRVLGTQFRDKRWGTWGMIPDPDCRPGNDQSYGFDICPGDEGENAHIAPAGQGYQGLLSFVGRPGYKDPGCWISGTYKEEDCALGLGTSTGAMGFRKFPNPKFDPQKWRGWESYDQMDGSQEPPFLIGTACGSCHITFNPNDPPADPNHPKWRNLKGLVGNQFQHMEEIIGSGLDKNSLEWQAIITARPGVVDTSAHPSDLVRNPNTVNAIINIDKRPPGLPAMPGEQFKSFDKTVVDEESGQRHVQRVHNILKGGEDDVGGAGAILRVYVNEGLCAETCWMNHLLDARTIEGRFGEQTPFSTTQCRRDCPHYRAVEARYQDVLEFFASHAGRPTDLKDAMFPNDPPETRYGKLVQALGPEKVKRGRAVYAKNCAECHSSLPIPNGVQREDFYNQLATEATGDEDPFLKEENGVRVDWLGNEEREKVTKIGTNRCRSLHSNHQRGHVWDVFSSESYKNSPDVAGIEELKGLDAGGRGYYRNPSLLSVWVQAPFMHNNAIGPELCNPEHPRLPVCQGDELGNGNCCVDKDRVPLGNGQTTSLTSVEGRLKMFDASMEQLLSPERRGKKIERTDADIIIPIGPQNGANGMAEAAPTFTGVPFLTNLGLMASLWPVGNAAQQLTNAKIKIPKGTPVALLGSLDYRKLAKGLAKQLSSTPAEQRPAKLVELLNTLFADPDRLAQRLAAGPGGQSNTYQGYSNCTDVIDDRGHDFGSTLEPEDKLALAAFMKTL
jgi:hypothetical protein